MFLNQTKNRLVVALFLASPMSLAIQNANAADNSDENIEEIHIYGEQGETDTATRLELTLFETPQTVTAVSRVQMDDFALTSINDVLDYTPGVTVEEVETNRSYFTARGFDIVNFQYDGVGVPFVDGLNGGRPDAATYEKVEVVKGAAGLITGLSNPSATVNFVRKRPTDELQASARVLANEWNGVRVDGDLSVAFSERIRARVVLAKEDTDSYLDRFKEESDVAYAVLEAGLSHSTLLTLGHSYDKNRSMGVLWGALPLIYSDGTQTDYEVSTSNAPEWTLGENTIKQSFVELRQELGSRWTFNAQYMQVDTSTESELFYVYGAPNPIDETGLGFLAGSYPSEQKQENYDLYFSGSFSLAGQDHQLVIGYSDSDTEADDKSFNDSVNGSGVLGSDWDEGNTPRPNFVDHDPRTGVRDLQLSQKASYFASRLNFTEKFSLLLGARRAEVVQEGVSYGGDANTEAKKTVPYYGFTYQFVEDMMLYGSYSEVFKQQVFVNSELRPLGAADGDSSEIGVKKSFNDGRAALTFALFQSTHENLGEFIGRNDAGIAIYEPREFKGSGYEIEFSGEVVAGLNVGAGFTKAEVEDTEGNNVRPYVPEDLLKLSAAYQLSTIPALKVGAVLKWQEEVSTVGDPAFVQRDYMLLDLAIHYDISEAFSIALNIDNLSNEKYIQSLYWTQGYYAEPRNVKASISWKL